MRTRHGSTGVQACFEALESRLLLSAGAPPATLVKGIAGTAVVVADVAGPLAGRVRTMDWRGEQVAVVSDEWIVRLADGAGKSLVIDLPGAVLEALGGGFGLLRGSALAAADLDKWAGGLDEVLYVEPNFVLSVAETAESTLPADTRFSSLWGLNNTGQTGGTPDADIDAPEAWDVTTGSAGVVVGVIDTGVDYNHPDLAANIWTNPGEVANDGIDNDGNGFIDDVHGWDFAYDDADPMDVDGHGTHVAGTIGGVGDNGLGVTGVNWAVSILPLKFLDDSGYGTTSDAVDAINYATMMRRDHGVNIVATNNSWGGGGYSSAVRDAIAAAGAQEILFVAAAGNGGFDGVGDNTDVFPHYPSSYDVSSIISVAATDDDDRRASFSNYGAASVDLAAPGVAVTSALPGSSYGSYSGTSMATPHVAGVVALLAAAKPAASAAEIRSAILVGADPVAAMAGLSTTGGRLNANGAIQVLTLAGPRVVSVLPGAAAPPTGEVRVTFSDDLDPTTVVPANFLLRDNGADNAFDTGDDVVYALAPGDLSRPAASQVRIDLGADLTPESYRLTVVGTGANPIRDAAGDVLNDGADAVHLFSIVTASGPFESNDAIAEATGSGLSGPGSVTLSAYVGDGFHGSRDVDLYPIVVPDGATIIADVDAEAIGTLLDPALRLFSSAGVQVAADDDTHGYDSYIEFAPAAAGTYYVGVSGYPNLHYDATTADSGNAGSVGGYDLHLTVAGGATVGVDVTLTGSVLTLGVNADGSLVAESPALAGAVLAGNEFLPGATPRASITLAAAGATYRNDAPVGDTPAIPMTLIDTSTGSQLAVRATGAAGGIDVRRSISFSSDDRYATIAVTLTNATASAIDGVAWLEGFDPNQGLPIAGAAETANDVRFDGDYAEAAVYLAAFPDGLTVAMGSPDARAVASNEGLGAIDPFDVIGSPADGDGVVGDVALNLAFDVGTLGAGAATTLSYYLILDTTATGARSRYQALIDVTKPVEPNDTLGTATPTGLTAEGLSARGIVAVDAAIGDGPYGDKDVDLFSIAATAGTTVTADIDAESIGSDLDPVLRLFDSTGAELTHDDDTDGLDSLLSYDLTADGIYYLGVSGYSNLDYDPAGGGSGLAGSTGDYTLDLTLAPTPPTTGDVTGATFNDVNGNGLRDGDEPGVAGWTVFLDMDSDGRHDPATTAVAVSTDVPRAIPDEATITSDLVVSGAGVVDDVNVTLDISHTWDDDLFVHLISPSGTRVELFSEVGGRRDNFTGTTLDDEADTDIRDGRAPFSGRYRPMGMLSDFDGGNANGTWQLEIYDGYPYDTGTLNSWSLTLTTSEPGATTDGNGEYALTGIEPGSYVVDVVGEAGWIRTYPAAGTHTVTFAAGEVVENVDFGSRIDGDVDVLLLPRIAPSPADTSDAAPASDTGPAGGAGGDPFWQIESAGYWVEAWVRSDPTNPMAILDGSVRISFDAAYAQAVAGSIEHGSVFDEAPLEVIDNAAGVVAFGGQTLKTDMGDDEYVLLGRVRFVGDAPVDELAHQAGPYDMALGGAVGPERFSLVGGGDVSADVQAVPSVDIRANIHDINDDGVVGVRDLAAFANTYALPVGGPEPPYSWWADYDRSDVVSILDFAMFVSAFRVPLADPAVRYPTWWHDPLASHGSGAFAPAAAPPAEAGPVGQSLGAVPAVRGADVGVAVPVAPAPADAPPAPGPVLRPAGSAPPPTRDIIDVWVARTQGASTVSRGQPDATLDVLDILDVLSPALRSPMGASFLAPGGSPGYPAR